MDHPLLAASPMPWERDVEPCLQALRAQLGPTGLLVGVLDPRQPRPDEILIAWGVPTDTIAAWFDAVAAGRGDHRLFERARHPDGFRGLVADTGWDRLDPRLDPAGPVIARFLSDGVGRRRGWFALALRPDGPDFSDIESDLFGLDVRRWHSWFNRPPENDMARLLVGSDHRLLIADPNAEQFLLDSGGDSADFMRTLAPIIEQRWPELDDHAHDVALEVDGRPWWIRFRRRHGLDEGSDAVAWFLELRPLRPGELVTTGLIDDERIAAALAYIHDHYRDSPTLTDIAEAVHVSPFHFHRLFSRQVGTTPKQYVLQKQVQMARWMLRARREAISRIAEHTGFASHGHFTSTFRRIVGVSPSKYRETSSTAPEG